MNQKEFSKKGGGRGSEGEKKMMEKKRKRKKEKEGGGGRGRGGEGNEKKKEQHLAGNTYWFCPVPSKILAEYCFSYRNDTFLF